ncbi:MAG: YbaK/EbsC family protein [Actinobacteria bacterium]|nr:YbaK/EbsC family protein [Actinomycetota bacterium]MBU1608297.1 YbaK/EbsC family protein [Actinomycetota bacterium]MBU2315271.1 YbaK/EbsC family protein [Actinomycetota bacterium]MBU2386236.1 YbaK/EbsC family protein [Actinomycetota bacterium]
MAASGAERFAAATAHLGLTPQRMPDSTHTAAEAAAAVGCEVGAIVKSLVFLADGEPVLALVSGDNRADLEALGAALGARIEKADAATVKRATGYSIGGVPPIGHPAPVRTVVDRDLLRYSTVWSAAGDAQSVFPASPGDLVEWSGGEVDRFGSQT